MDAKRYLEKETKTMTKHAKLSASGAHRWMACSASVVLEGAVAGSGGSMFAAEGTAAHELASDCLELKKDAEEYLGHMIDVSMDDGEVVQFEVTKEMVDAVQQYIDYVRDQPGELFIERRVDFSEWVPGGFGTGDAIIVHEGLVTVVDLKYGKGVRVDVENNPQAMCYGIGTVSEFDFLFGIDRIKLAIVQPRMDHIDEWELSRVDLENWANETLSPAAYAALADTVKATPGEKQCQWCKAKATCRALANYSLETAMEGFTADEFDIDGVGDPHPKDVTKLSNNEIGHLLPLTNLMAGWIKAVHAHGLSELEAGRGVFDHKLVRGKSNRKWIDEAKAGAALARKLSVAAAYRPKQVITITAAEKLLGKKDATVDKHTHKPLGGLAIAHSSDKRQAIEVEDVSDGFE